MLIEFAGKSRTSNGAKAHDTTLIRAISNNEAKLSVFGTAANLVTPSHSKTMPVFPIH